MIGGTFAATYPDRIGSAVLMNCTGWAAGKRQKFEYGLLLQMAKPLGGVRPPLTRSVLKAFLGPTSVRSSRKSRRPFSSSQAHRTRPSRTGTLAMAEAIPGAAVAALDGVAHLPGLENPPLVNNLIDEFVFRE